jgi:hypothetical protein
MEWDWLHHSTFMWALYFNKRHMLYCTTNWKSCIFLISLIKLRVEGTSTAFLYQVKRTGCKATIIYPSLYSYVRRITFCINGGTFKKLLSEVFCALLILYTWKFVILHTTWTINYKRPKIILKCLGLPCSSSSSISCGWLNWGLYLLRFSAGCHNMQVAITSW